jgi:hypothetical protein
LSHILLRHGTRPLLIVRIRAAKHSVNPFLIVKIVCLQNSARENMVTAALTE